MSAFASGENATICNWLYDFYSSLGGPSWTNRTGWSSAAAGIPTNYANFYGLTWATGVLKSIKLTNNNLVGTIPDSTGSLIAGFMNTSYAFMIGDGTSVATANGNDVCGFVPAAVAATCNKLTSAAYCSIWSYTYYSATVTPAIPSLKNCSSVPGSNFTCLASDDPDTCAVFASLYSDTQMYSGTTGDIYKAAAGYPTANGICDVPRFSTCVSGTAYCTSYVLAGGAGSLTCDASGNVVKISAASGGVAAPYPAQLAPNIGLLTSLTSLTIQNDNLGGTIPDSIGSLTALTYLQLGAGAGTNAHVTGIIPDIWAGLTALTSLSFYGDNLVGTFPASLGSLTSLAKASAALDFRNSPGLCGAIPPALQTVCGALAGKCVGGGSANGQWAIGQTSVACYAPPSPPLPPPNPPNPPPNPPPPKPPPPSPPPPKPPPCVPKLATAAACC